MYRTCTEDESYVLFVSLVLSLLRVPLTRYCALRRNNANLHSSRPASAPGENVYFWIFRYPLYNDKVLSGDDDDDGQRTSS